MKKYTAVFGIILLMAILVWYKGEVDTTGRTENTSPVSFVVVIDPGHGGFGNRPEKEERALSGQLEGIFG